MKKLMKYVGITTIALTAIVVAIRAFLSIFNFKPDNVDHYFSRL